MLLQAVTLLVREFTYARSVSIAWWLFDDSAVGSFSPLPQTIIDILQLHNAVVHDGVTCERANLEDEVDILNRYLQFGASNMASHILVDAPLPYSVKVTLTCSLVTRLCKLTSDYSNRLRLWLRYLRRHQLVFLISQFFTLARFFAFAAIFLLYLLLSR